MAPSAAKAKFDNKARGGSTRWTGKGPKPARHIPWPEVFKHHLSVVEGHQRMIDMIRKHTVEGTDNHRTIVECLNRADTMLKDTKQATRSFVQDPNDRNHVPLGSASDSMYVGYSPADHEYGEAANQYGQQMAQARKAGAEPTTGKKATTQASSKYSSGANGVPVAPRKGPEPVEQDEEEELVKPEVKKTAKAPEIEPNTIFFMDNGPAPASEMPAKSSKREHTQTSDRPLKKSKLRQSEAAPVTETEGEKEDISAEVDARLAEKERKRKEKKSGKGSKRKRESDDSAQADEEVHEDKMAVDDVEEKAEKPKKKKSKKTADNVTDEPAEEAEGPKGDKSKKKGKKSKEISEGTKRALGADAEDDSKPKKSKKSKKEKSEEV